MHIYCELYRTSFVRTFPSLEEAVDSPGVGQLVISVNSLPYVLTEHEHLNKCPAAFMSEQNLLPNPIPLSSYLAFSLCGFYNGWFCCFF